ncbi:hypothetical protein [Halarchaeum acidiphilum]|uniref:hypothetical protein n=1 Tax=Halarchaeum acidiphilum TaxID=489138 RepID=UPI0011D1A616|nr:hypothetical protein [Halarchaeum acidiphilum]
MSDFWAGYLWGRGSGDGPSLPPEIALLFGGLLVFVGILYLLRDVFNAIAGVTQAHPVLSLSSWSASPPPASTSSSR